MRYFTIFFCGDARDGLGTDAEKDKQNVKDAITGLIPGISDAIVLLSMQNIVIGPRGLPSARRGVQPPRDNARICGSDKRDLQKSKLSIPLHG